MKATDFLREREMVLEDKTDLIIGFSDGSKQSVIELLDNYARIQIEKDRVSESELMLQVKIDSKAYDQSERTCFLEGAETVLRQLRYRPINLD